MEKSKNYQIGYAEGQRDAKQIRIEKLEAALNEICLSGRIRNRDKDYQKRIETIISEVMDNPENQVQEDEHNSSQDEIYHLTVNENDVGNCLLFYRKDGKGYTLDLEQAHEFTQEDAMHTVEKASDKYRMWKRSTLRAVAQKHVDVNNAMEYESSKNEVKS